MVCRNSRMSSVITTFARDMSGLEDNQVLGIYHSLMREDSARGPEEGETTESLQAQHGRLVDEIERLYNAGDLRMNPGSHHPSRRLAAAREETADRSRMFAARRVVVRARRAARAQAEYLRSYARDLGVTESAASYEYWSAFQEASENSRLQPSAAFATAWRENPDHTDLPVDRRSMHAFEQMEIARATWNMRAETRPAVTRHPVESTAIAEMGYDPASGRVEIVMHSNPNRAYAYRMSPSEWAAFSSASSIGRYYAQNIRHNSDYQYGSAEEAAEASVHRRCVTCGQFAAAGSHECPVTGSEEDLNRDIREAVLRARARAAGDTTTVPVVAAATRLPATGTRRYLDDDGSSLRLRSISRLRQDTRVHSTVETPVEATFRGEEGDPAIVTGHVQAEYNGRGLGYDVTAVTEPGDSREDNLRCTCAMYRRNYHCEHIDATVDRVRGLMEGQQPLRTTVTAANAEALSGVTADHLAAETAVADERGGYAPRTVSFTDDPEAFQTAYTEARTAQRAYKDAIANGTDPAELDHPVPFVRQAGALGGLCTRDSGRGFGMEIEYSFPQTMSWAEIGEANRRIGRELYELGLTDQTAQKYYGATHGRTPSQQHARGWSFEQDPSTGASDANAGGEIVSPVMYDEAETWENLEKVTAVLKRNGAIASKGAGAHVHVGAGDYDHTVANYNRLLASYGEYEDVLYRLSTDPNARNHRPTGYCAPNSVPSSPYTEIGSAARQHTGHHLALNLQSMRGREESDNIEFRMFDSSLNPGVMQTQVMIAASVTAAASRETGNPRPNTAREPVGTHLNNNTSRNALTGDAWRESTASVRSFIDRFIPGGADGGDTRAKQIVSIFAMTRWQRG